jgi:hypothetical protein
MRGQLNPQLNYQVSGFVGSQYISSSPRDHVSGISGTVSIRLSERFALPVTVAADDFGPYAQQSILTRLVVWF